MIKLKEGEVVRSIEVTEDVVVSSKSLEAQIALKKATVKRLNDEIKAITAELKEVKVIEEKLEKTA